MGSVLEQDFQDYELIIVDDASTDATPQALKALGGERRVRTVCLPKNSGVSQARNRGAQLSRGTWLAFLDSDDQWAAQKLSRQYQSIQESPSFVLFHCEEIWIRRGVRVNPMKKHQKSGGQFFERSLARCLISPSGAIIKKSTFFELGQFNPHFPVCEDYDLWGRLLCRYPVGFDPTPLVVKYGGHADQLSKKYVAMDYWRALSLSQLLSTAPLCAHQKRLVAREILKKTHILIQGHRKHQGPLPISEVERIRSEALGFIP